MLKDYEPTKFRGSSPGSAADTVSALVLDDLTMLVACPGKGIEAYAPPGHRRQTTIMRNPRPPMTPMTLQLNNRWIPPGSKVEVNIPDLRLGMFSPTLGKPSALVKGPSIGTSPEAWSQLSGAHDYGFGSPRPTAAEHNQFWIIDSNTHRVMLVRDDGEIVMVIGGPTCESGHVDSADCTKVRFNSPCAGATLRDDTLIVCDMGNHCLRAIYKTVSKRGEATWGVKTILGTPPPDTGPLPSAKTRTNKKGAPKTVPIGESLRQPVVILVCCNPNASINGSGGTGGLGAAEEDDGAAGDEEVIYVVDSASGCPRISAWHNHKLSQANLKRRSANDR